MTETPDKESKTEKATEKRTNDAIEKGNLPFSREIVTFASMLALVAVCGLMAADATRTMTALMASLLGQSASIRIGNGADAAQSVASSFSAAAKIALPPLLVLMIGGILGALVQNVPAATLERLRPQWQRVSPAANAKRMFGKEGLIEFLKIAAKTLIVMSVAGYALYAGVAPMLSGGLAPVGSLPVILRGQTMTVVSQLALAALFFAVADGVWSRLKWSRNLMMTRQEVKDEFRQSEGDPLIKQQIRALARRRNSRRMMTDLPRATVVVANPTHFAVALRYVPSEGGAPVVVAKGMDHLALRIRAACGDLGIPVVENKPLARALHGAAVVGDMIPVEFYRAVAEIVHFVEMRKTLRGQASV
jgi:flagellar biosynthetic protein FlhB